MIDHARRRFLSGVVAAGATAIVTGTRTWAQAARFSLLVKGPVLRLAYRPQHAFWGKRNVGYPHVNCIGKRIADCG